MKRVSAYLLFLMLTASAVASGSDDAGTESPFAFGAGARDLSLGGSALAFSDATTAPFWNPSRLARAGYYSLSGFHTQLYESDVAYQYFGAVIPTLDYGTLGIGVFRLGVDGIEKRDAANLLLGEFDDSRLGFYLAYGRTIAGYDIGASLNIENHSIDTYSATTSPGLNMALSRQFESPLTWLNHVNAALNARNVIRPSMDLAEVTTRYPFALDAGVAANVIPGGFFDHTLTLSAAMSKVDRVEARFAMGIEYNIAELIHIRSGVCDSRMSFGLGLSYRMIRFDYALVDRDLGALHMFTLTTTLGRSMSEREEDRSNRREAEFNRLMNERLIGRNREAVVELVERGRSALAEGMLEDAVDLFDRARFMAISSQVDTIEIARYSAQARERLAETQQIVRYGQYLDSAQVELSARDYLAARYFAGRALAERPNSGEAKAIIDEANRAIAESAAQDELIRQRLWTVDSLLSYGQLEQAAAIVRQLDQYAETHETVKRAQRRVQFEQHREIASAAYARSDFAASLRAIESASALFPGHQWCLDLKSRIEREQSRRRVAVVTPPAPRSEAPLAAEVQREVETAYRSAQQSFQRGDLEEAISQWESVERLAPGYQSVREYLVNAYKFVGVERYGRNQLRDAVAIWRKAAVLAPDNKEIAGYIERTENEIRKLEELSYEQ